MLAKRIIPCLDVRDGMLTKGIKFQENINIGDPILSAKKYYEQGADEIVFYDITASFERRSIFLHVVEKVASQIFIPFSVGGGIYSLQDMRDVLNAGAEKVSVNSGAVKNPDIIAQGAATFGVQCIVLGMDVQKVPVQKNIPSGFEVVTHGGRNMTGIDALAWAKKAELAGAGEICLNSIDADGTKNGFNIELTKLITDNVSIPVIASGGAGKPEHLADAFLLANASAAIVASIVHYDEYSLDDLKSFLVKQNIPVRTNY